MASLHYLELRSLCDEMDKSDGFFLHDNVRYFLIKI